MLNVIIEAEGFPSPQRLKQILEERNAIVKYAGHDDETHNKKLPPREAETCFLCSKKYFNSINGQTSLINIAKGFKATFIVVVGQIDNTHLSNLYWNKKCHSLKYN